MSILLTWSDINPGEDGFIVYRSANTMDPNALPAALVSLPADTTEYLDTAITAGETYYYRVSVYKEELEVVSHEVVVTAASGSTELPSDRFSEGQAGLWYDVSDLSTLWADTSATTPASVDGLVARMDDKSGNGVHMIQSNSTLQPTLRQVGSLYYLEFRSDYMQAGNQDWIDTASELIVSVTADIVTPEGVDYGGLVSQSTIGSSAYKGFNLRKPNSTGVSLQGLGADNHATDTASHLDEVRVYTGLWIPNSIKVRSNGVETGSTAITSNNPNSGGASLTLGALSYGTNLPFRKSMNFYGAIIIVDDVVAQADGLDAWSLARYTTA